MTDAAPASLGQLLGLPVRHRGITLGHVTDVLLDHDEAPIGLAVLSIADEPGFLPWPSAQFEPDEVQVPYPLALLSETELEFYRDSSRSLVDERGAGDEPAVANG